jgi:aspartate 1-decarboxylase
MMRTFLRAKLHRATVTAAKLDYEGSISIDPALCREADLCEFEQVDVYNLNNGARFTTYVIYGDPGQVQVNGAAARLVQSGDRVIVAAYLALPPDEVARHQPKVVLLGEGNAVSDVRTHALRQP